MRVLKLDAELNEPVLNVAMDTIRKDKQALIFVNTKRSAEKVAEDIAKKLKNAPDMETIAADAENVLGTPTKQCLRLSRCLAKGIAFHHAGLHQHQRELIEDNFRDGKIRIICSTPTLAAGLDLPAFRAIIRDLKRHGGTWGMSPIPVLEYHQMAGRAGRPGKDPYGEAITLAKSEDEREEIRETYVRGQPEKIYSKLAVEPVLRTYVLSLVATGYAVTEESLIDFFSRTFWAAQYGDMSKLRNIILKMIDLLESYGFIYKRSKQDDFVAASELDTKEEKLRATLLGKRVAELYLDPYTANHLVSCLRDAREIGDVQLVSYLQMISHTIEMRPLVRMRKKNEDMVSDFLLEYSDSLLEAEPSLYDEDFQEFYDSVNTSLFFQDWIEEKDEEFLLERYNIRPGETRYKLDKAEWLLFACTEFAKILDLRDMLRILNKLSVRIKYGVKEELLPLLKFKNIGRVRARKLFENGLHTSADIRKISLTSLSQIVGGKLAASMKEQMGEEVKEIPKGTRKGQHSLEKYQK